MNNILIPAGVAVFLGLFVYAFISTARKQRMMKSMVFRDLAQEKGLHYEAQDDGSAERFAEGMDGLGQFNSPSLGHLIPADVTVGNLKGMEIVLFRHMTRFHEGYSREWFVAGVRAKEDIAERCSLEFFKNQVAGDSMYLRDPVVKERKAGPFHVVVRAPSPVSAGRMMDDGVLEKLAGLAGGLPFRPEIQVRATRVAVYPGDRNATVETAGHLEKLLDFSTRVAAA